VLPPPPFPPLQSLLVPDPLIPPGGDRDEAKFPLCSSQISISGSELFQAILG